MTRLTQRFRVVCLGLSLFSCIQAVGQQPQSPTNGSSILPIEQIKKTVVFLHGTYVDDKITKGWDGTGFCIYQPDPRLKDRGITWLVTNKHMIRQPSSGKSAGPFFKEVTIRVNTVAPNRGGLEYTEFSVPVTDGAGNLLWCVHPDETVDLAALRIGIDEDLLDVKAVPTDQFAIPEQFKVLNISENDDVLFAGLFPSYHGLRRNIPIVRHGKLALLTDERIPIRFSNGTVSEDVILAEVTAFGGNSGSPVFLRLGGIREGSFPAAGFSYYLLGVMQGCFNQGTEFSIRSPEVVKGFVAENTGIAAVVPSRKILEILDTPRAKAQTMLVIANDYSNRGKLAEAEQLYNNALSMSETAVGPYHPEVAEILEAYSMCLQKQNRTMEAFLNRQRAQEIRNKISRNSKRHLSH